MKKKISKEFILSIIVCLVPFAIAAVFYNRLPDMMATHFDFSGNPDSFTPKFRAVIMLPCLMIFMNCVVWFMLENDPKRKNASASLKRISRWLIPVLSVGVQCFTIAYSIGAEMKINLFVMVLLGVVFILVGNYLPKCKQNYTVGIKLPWTLDDEENWNRTHRLAGYLWVLGGIVMFVNAFFNSYHVLWAVVVIMTGIPACFSYFLYMKKSKGE